MMLSRTHTSQPGSDAFVTRTLSLLPSGTWGLALWLEQPSQLAHVTKLLDAGPVKELGLLHGLQDARACPESQDDGNDLGYSGRPVTGIRRARPGQKCLDQRDLGRACPGGPADSTASDRQRPSAWGAGTVCVAWAKATPCCPEPQGDAADELGNSTPSETGLRATSGKAGRTVVRMPKWRP